MDSRWREDCHYVKKHLGGMREVLDLLGERKLELRDAAVLYGLEAYCSWRTGRVKVTPRKLGERLSMQEKHVISSLSRLKRMGLLAKGIDDYTGDWFYMLNPRLMTVGVSQRSAVLWEMWEKATGGMTQAGGVGCAGSTTGSSTDV